MTHTNLEPLEPLRIADPETYAWVQGRLAMLDKALDSKMLTLLANETIWGLTLETGLGEALAKGLLRLMVEADPTLVSAYVQQVHRAAKTGATLARIVANFRVPVLLVGDNMAAAFDKALTVMLSKGTYSLTAPLEVLSEMLNAREHAAALAYLDLLNVIFRQSMSYNQSLRLVYLLPKAVRSFAPQRRKAQIEQFIRVAQVDLQLVDPFIDGLDKGSGLLDPTALEAFITLALDRYDCQVETGLKFLSLNSKAGQEACADLQKVVLLSRANNQINRYLQARTGRAMAAKSLDDCPDCEIASPWVASDGRFIYLPAEIAFFENQEQNLAFFKALSRLEAGYFEYGTYDFDLERAADGYAVVARWLERRPILDPTDIACDGERFIGCFDQVHLSDDLFTLFEQARIRIQMAQNYPGLVRQVLPLLQDECLRMARQEKKHLLFSVYAELVLDMALPPSIRTLFPDLQEHLIELFKARVDHNSPVEATAEMVILAYQAVAQTLGKDVHRYTPMPLPFDRRIQWQLVSKAFATHERSAVRIKMRLAEKNLSVYRSDVRNRLVDQQGHLSATDIGRMVLSRDPDAGRIKAGMDLVALDLDDLFKGAALEAEMAVQRDEDAFIYPEWDWRLQDYLQNHTFVREIEVAGSRQDQFYRQTLARHHGMVARMRRAFELLKPEGLALLRQWPEGDAFDYRALIDYAMDRRAGRVPSDRLFIQRLKQVRDVAVLVLVDLSRSTANPVAERHTTVLGVAKEALVLFCEALQVVGDTYAIAGFSGTGRHSVEYFRIKDFQEPLTESVRTRLSALRSQRSTRMGAAIRHATVQLSENLSRVKLLIVVSDGFPNDMGYKADYAIADTRHAVLEARAKGCHVKAITVNIGSDPRLDELYGRFHHLVIGDVGELPDKLLRLYGTLTRF